MQRPGLEYFSLSVMSELGGGLASYLQDEQRGEHASKNVRHTTLLTFGPLLLLLLLLHVGQTIVGKVVSINIAILSLKFKSHKHLISVVLFDSALNNLHMESC